MTASYQKGSGDVFQYADGAPLTFSLEANGSAVTDRQTAARTEGGRRLRTQSVRVSFDRCSFLPSRQAVLSWPLVSYHAREGAGQGA